MATQFDGQLQLGADPVGPGHQHRLAVAVEGQFEEGAEATEAGQHPRAEGGRGQGLDAFDQGVARVDVDPSRPVAQAS